MVGIIECNNVDDLPQFEVMLTIDHQLYLFRLAFKLPRPLR